MTKLTSTIEIKASPENVFIWITDINNLNVASKGFAEFTSTSKDPFGLGTTLHSFIIAMGHKSEWNSEVTEFVKNKKYVLSAAEANKIKMQNTYTFEPTAEGTKATIDTEYELPSRLYRLFDANIRKAIEKGTNQTLENMKKILEA
jgi:uncharacterized protein YndB with AHSA1/START domain